MGTRFTAAGALTKVLLQLRQPSRETRNGRRRDPRAGAPADVICQRPADLDPCTRTSRVAFTPACVLVQNQSHRARPALRDRIPLHLDGLRFKPPGLPHPPQDRLFRAATAAHETRARWRSRVVVAADGHDPRDVMNASARLPATPRAGNLLKHPLAHRRPETRSDAMLTQPVYAHAERMRPLLDWLPSTPSPNPPSATMITDACAGIC